MFCVVLHDYFINTKAVKRTHKEISPGYGRQHIHVRKIQSCNTAVFWKGLYTFEKVDVKFLLINFDNPIEQIN